jgi:cell division transport system permease protein
VNRQLPPDVDYEPVQETAGRSSHLPIVPEQAIAGRALLLVIAIMTLLAGLTVGAVAIVTAAAEAWQSDISREITIEVRPVEGVDQDAAVASALAIARATPGVAGAQALSDLEQQRLLAPFLGSGIDLSGLPVPRLITLSVTDPGAVDLTALAAELEASVPGAAVSSPDVWIDRLKTMAATMVVGGLVVLALVLAAMILSVVFATRAAMAGNRHIIEVLHFVGAENRFVAGEFQRHFLLLGVKGGAVGGGIAMLIFAFGGLILSGKSSSAAAQQLNAFIGEFGVGLEGYAAVAGIVIAVAALTALTSRYAVQRSLARIE